MKHSNMQQRLLAEQTMGKRRQMRVSAISDQAFFSPYGR